MAADLPAASNQNQDDNTKRRVPKDRQKDNDRDRLPEDADDEDDDDDDGNDCVGSCLSSMITDILSGDDDEEEAVPDTIPSVHGFVTADKISNADAREFTVSPTDTPTPVTHAPEPAEPTDEMRFVLLLSTGWGPIGPAELADEYHSGAWRVAVNSMGVMDNAQVGLVLGLQLASGEPLFDYATSSQLDVPSNSRLTIFDIGLRVGQYVSPGGGNLRIYWGLGPELFWVKESADLELYSLPGRDLLSAEKVSLQKWRFGGDVAFGLDWRVGGDLRLGFQTRFYLISWSSDEVESLTTDFIGKQAITGFNFGLTIGYDGF